MNAHLAWIPLVALAAVGCAQPEPVGQSGSYDTESLTSGQPLVSCWTQLDELDQAKQIRCALDDDGPIKVIEARIDTPTRGELLTPEHPEAILHSSNMLGDVSLHAKITADASAVAGLGAVSHEADIEITSMDQYPASAPALIRAPFVTWSVNLVGHAAALSEAKLEPYTLSLPTGELQVAPVLPDVAMGEGVTAYIATQRDAALAGTARFSDGAGLDSELAIAIHGDGTYLAGADGLQRRTLPLALECWMDALVLSCRAGDAGGLSQIKTDLDITLADGSTRQVQLIYDDTKVMVIGVEDGGYAEVEGPFEPVKATELSPDSFPISVKATVWLQGDVVAMGKDTFSKAPLVGQLDIASPEQTAPQAVMLPLQLWRITLRPTDNQASQYLPLLDGYDVTLATTWNGIEAGAPLHIDGTLPMAQTNGSDKPIFLPAPLDGKPASGTLNVVGVPFSLPGPGAYVVSASGISPAD